MKQLILIILLLLSANIFGQSLDKQKKAIDSIVLSINKDPKKQSVDFNIQALKKVLHYIDYHYETKAGETIKIVRRFKKDIDSIVQVFYLKRDQLIYSIEMITSYYHDKNIKDSIRWSGTYYFSKGKLIDYVTLGHGKSESDNPDAWNPQLEVFNNLQTSKKDIIRYNKRRNGG